MNFSILPRSWAAPLLSVLRIVTGLLFLEHGTGKLLGFPHLPFVDKMPAGMLYFTGVMEFVGGVLITLGLITRPAAFVLSGYMAVAYFYGPFPEELLPHGQRRRTSGALLLHLSLCGCRRSRPVGDR